MLNFTKNCLKGLVGLTGIILFLILAVIIGMFLWVLVAGLGLIGYGILRFLAGIIAAGILAVLVLWLLGAIMSKK